MGALRNPVHERFAREWLKTADAANAYRKAFGKTYSHTVAKAAGWRLRNRPYMQKRIDELQRQMMKRSDITLDKILSDYQEALDMARDAKKPSEMVMAAREQAKITGLLIERKEVGGPNDFDSMNNMTEILEAVRKQAGDEAALALARVFKLAAEEQKDSAPVDTEALLEAKAASDSVN